MTSINMISLSVKQDFRLSYPNACMQSSPGTTHADLWAHVEQGAGRAAGALSRTDLFAERHYKAIQIDPVALGKYPLQRGQGGLRSAGAHVAPAVHHTMHMDVHTNVGLTARDSKGEARAFGANSMETQQRLA